MTTIIDREPEFETVDLDINMGPQHPSTHGVFRMVLTIDGELVTDVVPHIGYMHRGAEKICENMDYRQGVGYMDRTEYLGELNAELAYVIAAERLGGLEVPERAEYMRVIGSELNRLASHFMFMGAFAADVGIFGTGFTYAFRERENIQNLLEEVCGDRMMFNYFHPGGLAWDTTPNFPERCRWVLKQVRQGIKDVDGLMTKNEIFIARCRGIGAISKQEAIDYGVTGPTLRASGHAFDIRKEEPYSIYDRFEFDIPTGQYGDVYDRYLVRLEEMRQSVRIIEQALDQLPEGPIKPEKMPRILRPPTGEIYVRTEAPRGEFGIYAVSTGGAKPYRLKVRSPCFSNLSALRTMTIGSYIADAVIILGSIDIVLCEVDR